MSAQFLKANFYLLFIFFLTSAISSFPQILDQTFSPILQDFGWSANGFPSVHTTVAQSDRKIPVGGKFTVANGVARS